MSENGEKISHENGGFRGGQDLQPVGDYAEIEPYYRVCEDVVDVQNQEQNEPEVFTSGDWWWNQHRIRFLNGKAFIGLSVLLLLIPYIWGGLVLVGGGWSFYYYFYLLVMGTPDTVFMLAMLFAALVWIPISLYIIIKTMPWVVAWIRAKAFSVAKRAR